MNTFESFGETIPYAEPSWYQGFPTNHYTEAHVAYRKKVRDFVESRLIPNIDTWIDSPNGYPQSLHKEIFDAGISGILFDEEYGGTKPNNDYFFELILWDELGRCCGGQILSQLSVNTMALPPMEHASPYIKEKIAKDVVQGRKTISLAISEPNAGSDVSGLQTVAKREGDHYIVNGSKKWITGGAHCDYFTLACKTEHSISLFLVDAKSPGIKIRKMGTQFDTSLSTAYIIFEDVKVPANHLIGEEDAGFMYLMTNFNHERFVIAASATRLCRMCYSESFKHAKRRKTFGKPLIKNQLIRYKLAEMIREIEALQAFLEQVAFQMSGSVDPERLGIQCALLKVQASRTFAMCANEATQIFGGSAIVKEGVGKLIERMYREVKQIAISGGSEEIMLDFSLRQIAKMESRL